MCGRAVAWWWLPEPLLELQDTSRQLYLFDTFEACPRRTVQDVHYAGRHATQVLRDHASSRCDDAPLEEVREVIYKTGYPPGKIHFVKGKVEDTIPGAAPAHISLLRLIRTGTSPRGTSCFICIRG